MPEEINRVVTDRLSDLLFATSADAVAHLAREGVDPEPRSIFVGNPMIDTLLAHRHRVRRLPGQCEFGLGRGVRRRHAAPTRERRRPGGARRAGRRGAAASPTSCRSCSRCTPRAAPALEESGTLRPPERARDRAAGLPRVPGRWWPASALVRHRLGRDPGGDDRPRRPVLHAAAQHRAAGHHHRRHQSAGHARESVGAAVAAALAAGSSSTWPVPPLWDGQAGERIARIVVEFLRG